MNSYASFRSSREISTNSGSSRPSAGGESDDLVVLFQLLDGLPKPGADVWSDLRFDLLAGAADGILGNDLVQIEVVRCAIFEFVRDNMVF